MKNKVFKFKTGKQADLIDEAIQKAGSQQKLSSILSIPRKSIWSYKSEKYLIPLERLTKILAFVNKKVEDISEIIVCELPKYWGQKKAAKKFLNKFSNNELKEYMAHVRKFKKQREYNLQLPITSELCELYGILIGDGCITKYKDSENVTRCDVVIAGDKRYEYEFYLYIKKLLKENFNVNCYRELCKIQ